jgi:hypothetical protein
MESLAGVAMELLAGAAPSEGFTLPEVIIEITKD